MQKIARYSVMRLLEDNTLAPALDEDGEAVYKVGTVPTRVRAAAEAAAYICAEREPDAHFVVIDGQGAEVLDLAPIGVADASECPF